MEPLSPRQQEMLDFIVSVIDQRGVPPSYREIGSALGIGSTNGVSDHIKALLRKGYLERVGGRGNSRSLRVPPAALDRMADEETVGVPVLGRIAAGTPLLAEENYDGSLRVDAGMLPPGGGVFALVVNGDSMIEDGIHDGDYLFVRQKTEVRRGDIAVVMVDGEATVKRFFREGSRIRLQPANAAMEPIYVDAASGGVEVIGEAVGVFRKIR
jgi:repressor LexA